MASSAGEALPAELGMRFTEIFGADVVDGIGSTEMLHIFLSNCPGEVRYGTTGWPCQATPSNCAVKMARPYLIRPMAAAPWGTIH